MVKRNGDTSPWHDLEVQAYHAFREWPIWLLLRQRELDKHLGMNQSRETPAASVPNAVPQRKKGGKG